MPFVTLRIYSTSFLIKFTLMKNSIELIYNSLEDLFIGTYIYNVLMLLLIRLPLTLASTNTLLIYPFTSKLPAPNLIGTFSCKNISTCEICVLCNSILRSWYNWFLPNAFNCLQRMIMQAMLQKMHWKNSA